MPTPKGIALTIGINKIDPNFYAGDVPELAGCIHDANDIAAIAEAQDPKIEVQNKLFDKDATAANLKRELEKAAKALNSGDFFLLHYSGHGMDMGEVTNGDQDTAWCLFDGPFIDNDLFELWFQFKPGVRILVLSDSCHSGTAVRYWAGKRAAKPRDASGKELPKARGLTLQQEAATMEKHPQLFRELQARSAQIRANRLGQQPGAAVLLISGCQDNQVSNDGDGNGMFTAALKQVWNNGAFQGGYSKFHRLIQQMVEDQSRPFVKWGSCQSPNLCDDVGDPNLIANFKLFRPFEV